MILHHKGIEFHISPLFFIIISTLLLFDKSGYMSFSLLFSLLHEFGHIAMMFILNKPPRTIKLLFYGFEIKTLAFTKLETILISITGPITNFLFAIFFQILSVAFGFNLQFAVYINAFIGFFNLFPIANLDGGDILFSFLLLKYDYFTSKKITKVVSLVLAALVLIIGTILIVYGNIGVLFIGIYLFICNLIKSD